MGMSAPAKNLLMVCEAKPSQAGLGRFLSRDALGSLNRYAYCYNNPVDWVDVDGLAPEPPGYHVTTGSGGENLYYNDASYHNAPNQIPPSWSKTRETRDVNRYSNTEPDTLMPFRMPKPIEVPDLGDYPLGNYDIGDCPKTETKKKDDPTWDLNIQPWEFPRNRRGGTFTYGAEISYWEPQPRDDSRNILAPLFVVSGAVTAGGIIGTILAPGPLKGGALGAALVGGLGMVATATLAKTFDTPPVRVVWYKSQFTQRYSR